MESVLSCDDLFMQKALSIINDKVGDHSFDLECFADSLNISKSTLYRRLSSISGVSPCELVTHIRMEKAKQLLLDRSLNISEIAYNLGFRSPHYFSQCFKAKYGTHPKAFRSKLPDVPGNRLTDMNREFVTKATSLIEDNISVSEYDYGRLAQDLNLSMSSLYRKIKQITGKSPGIFIRSIKLKYARRLLEMDLVDIQDVAFICGFEDAKYFSKCFRLEFGISPTQYVHSGKVIQRIAM